MIAENIEEVKLYLRGVLSMSTYARVEAKFCYEGVNFYIYVDRAGHIKLDVCNTDCRLFEGEMLSAYIVRRLADVIEKYIADSKTQVENKEPEDTPIDISRLEEEKRLTINAIVSKALEKEIPKKVVMSGWSHIAYCPKCLGAVWQNGDEGKFCFRCGQALSWSEEK